MAKRAKPHIRNRKSQRSRRVSSSRQEPQAAESSLVQYLDRGERQGLASTVVPCDETLLECARTQWQFGDWDSLAQISRETLQHHPERARLALLAAAGHLQSGSLTEARTLVRLAREWGCSQNLISRILVAGVYNSLGRAAAIAGYRDQALDHFENSLTIGTPGAEGRLLTQARAAQQLFQLDHSSGANLHEALVPLHASDRYSRTNGPSIQTTDRERFRVSELARLELGWAWAGNTINTVIFRHHAILTSDEFQYTAYYVDEHTLRLVQRHLEPAAAGEPEQPPRTHDLPGEYNLRDAHNSISLGIDRQGYLHLCYDHHGTQLRYRRALEPQSIGRWSEELPMTGAYEENVTYPTFILPRHGYPLTLLYRDGSATKGTARLKTYSETQQRWEDHSHPVLSGSDEKPWSSNAYWNHPAIDHEGALHISFVWRTHSLGEEQRINNINIGYARSRDNGHSWITSRGRAYQLPITPVNAETVYPVSPGSNLINQCSMAVDSSNNPHIVFYADDDHGIPQYQHIWWDGNRWHHQVLSQRGQAFSLEGGGTLRIPISRPEILLDRNDNVFVIYRGDLTDNRMTAQVLVGPDYEAKDGQTLILWNGDLGYAEPVLDRTRWAMNNILTLLVQHNEQPDGDREWCPLSQPVTLIDLVLRPEQAEE